MTCSLLLTACPGTPTPDADKTPPAVSLNAVAPTAPGAVTLSATATDAGGIDRVEFYQGATLIATDTTAPYSTDQFTVDQRNNGSLAFSVRAYDKAGNVSTATTSTTVAINTLYQGQYYWALFTDPNNIEGSIRAEGVALYADQYVSQQGNLMADGAYFKGQPAPEQSGEAILGPVAFEGQTFLSTLFLYDTAEAPLYFWGEDADGTFSDLGGQQGLVGDAALFNLDGSVAVEGYFVMLRMTSNPYEGLSTAGQLSAGQVKPSAAMRQAALTNVRITPALRAQTRRSLPDQATLAKLVRGRH
ncbi:Ig-like domain-containing protein [Deinococcus hohokamensis]|uniref:Ig-like domain-containing protein n=1 Tax=Deinococcus hohokamensis TaxID=309883 RepID=A0ABV9I6P2_9DEIO